MNQLPPQFDNSTQGTTEFATSDPPLIPPSSEMAASVAAVERIIQYNFRNKRLLEEALTHSSCTDSASYERLEFIGDAVVELALRQHFFLAYPKSDPRDLSPLLDANVSTEKFGRVAIKHGFYEFLRRNATASLDEKVKEFSDAVNQEDDLVIYCGSVKAPDVLADIVESVAAAVYVDVDFDLQRLWEIFRGLMEPIITLEDLQKYPQPVTRLYHLCQKHGKQVIIKCERMGMETIASVFVNDDFVASGSGECKDVARINAALAALEKLGQSMPTVSDLLEIFDGIDGSLEIEDAKERLHKFCAKKKWPKPSYKPEKEIGPSHKKSFVYSVQIETADDLLYKMGDEKARVKDAKNSAASFMLRALRDSKYL